jgi:hypothetical protein
VIERKTDAINLRMAPATKELLRLAASKERRTLSNMIDFLILDHCERNGIAVAAPAPKSLRTAKSKVNRRADSG